MSAVGAAKVESLKSALAQAKEEARASKAAADKAVAELKTEQVARRQHEERVTEVQQELKAPSANARLWRRSLRPKRPNSPKPSMRPRRRGPSPGRFARRSGRPNR